MADPVTWAVIGGIALSAGTAGMGAYSSAQQASGQAKSQRAMEAAHAQEVAAREEAAAIQVGQFEAQADLEEEKVSRQAHLIRSRIRVAAGESGIGLGGTYDALIRQIDYDQRRNVDIIDENAAMQADYARSQAFVPAIQEPYQMSPFLAGLSGGMGGLSSGLSMGNSIMSMGSSAGKTK